MNTSTYEAAPIDQTVRELRRTPAQVINLETLIVCASILAISIALYSPILNVYFLGDDFGSAQLYINKKLLDWPRLFYSDGSEGMWGFQLNELRPITELSFIWDGFIWKANAMGYHLTNVLFHGFNSILVFFVARVLVVPNKTMSAAAGLLFAFHPAHAEAVTWISGRDDVIATLFFTGTLLSFGLYRSRSCSRYYFASLALFAAALFSKEMALSLPIVLLSYDLLLARDFRLSARRLGRWLPHAGYVVILAFYLCMRVVAFGSALRPNETVKAASFGEFIEMQPGFLLKLLPPLNLLIGEPMRAWPVVIGAVLLTLTGLMFLRLRRNSDANRLYRAILFFGPVWYLVSIIPLRALPRFSGRHSYLPSVGICLALGALICRIGQKRFLIVTLLLLLVCYGADLVRNHSVVLNASKLSYGALAKIEVLERETQPGTGLILDVPKTNDGILVWGWATPFVLQPPFSSIDMYGHFQVLESPSTYYRKSWVADKKPVVQALVEWPVESYLIGSDSSDRLVIRRVGKELLKTRLEEFQMSLQDAELDGHLSYVRTRKLLMHKWRILWESLLEEAPQVTGG